MQDFKDAVMVALLPTNSEWCNIELPHMTLVYAGLIADQKPGAFNSLAKDAASIAMTTRAVQVKVIGVETFGGQNGDEAVQALKLENTSTLRGLRHFVESWNQSEYPFNPHATIGPVGQPRGEEPLYLTFDRIMVAWGEEQLTFWLKQTY